MPRATGIYPCSQQQASAVWSGRLDEFVHACIDASLHAPCVGIDHTLQDAHTPIEPPVALIFGLKGG